MVDRGDVGEIEQAETVYYPVIALTPQFARTSELIRRPDARYLAYEVSEGSVNLSTPAIPELKNHDRIIRYVRTEDMIYRIEPNGELSLRSSINLKTGKDLKKDPGYKDFTDIGPLTLDPNQIVKVDEPLSITFRLPPPQGVSNPVEIWRVLEGTKVQHVLFRTEEPVEEGKVSLETDTVLISAAPFSFDFSPDDQPISKTLQKSGGSPFET